MSKDTDNSLFIVSSRPRLYQHLLGGIASFQELGNRIIRQITTAHAFRQVEQVRELARLLVNIPIKEYQLIAHYYLVWCKCREYEYPATTLEKIVEQTQTYKTKALFSRAAMEVYQGDFEHALYFYSEAFKSNPTFSEYIDLSRSIAGLKSLEGFHKSALIDLEKLIPFINYAEPRLYYDFLNSYAVELGEVGRKDEARSVIKHVLDSPFAFAYPEWCETAEELKPANRSFVVPDPSPPHMGKLLSMPVVEQAKPQRLDRPAKIINLQAWKKKMGKDDDDRYGLTPEQLKEMTPSEKLCYILNSINPDFTDEDFDRVIDLVDEINDKKKK
jgi:tetratricopeptide (TPR) repeat protein